MSNLIKIPANLYLKKILLSGYTNFIILLKLLLLTMLIQKINNDLLKLQFRNFDQFISLDLTKT